MSLKGKKIVLAYPLHNNNNGYIKVNWIDTLEDLSNKHGFKFESIDFLDYKKRYGPRKGTELFVEHVINNLKPDILVSHITADHFVPGPLYELKKAGIKTINIFFEGAHCFEHCVKDIIKCFDYWTDLYLPGLHRYEQLGAKAFYLPVGVNSEFMKKINVRKYEEREIDVSFIGSCYCHNRIGVFEAIRNLGVKLHVYGMYWEELAKACPECVKSAVNIDQEKMYSIYSNSKIVVNFSDVGDKRLLRGRDFEATACGALLITGRFAEIEKLFNPAEVLFYEKEEEIPKLVKRAIENQETYSGIAENGRRRTLKEHTWQDRFEYLFKKVGAL